jgi:hypothetical protein
VSFTLVLGAFCANAALESGFDNPPMEYRPGVFWEWCNGNINKASITSDLEAMHRVGMQGGKVFNVSGPQGPVRFASDEWFEMMAHVCEEAGRLDMEVGLNLTEGFNCAGGPWVTPDRSMQALAWNETNVSGPGNIKMQLEKPKPVYLKFNPKLKIFPPEFIKEMTYGFYEDVKVFAVPTVGQGRILEWKEKSGIPEGHHFSLEKVLAPTPVDSVAASDIIETAKVIDISDKMDADGNLNWKAPAGKWTILRMGRMSTGSCTRPGGRETTGLDVDKLSRENVKFHFDHMAKPLLDKKNVVPAKNIKFLGIDSWEAGSQNWSVVLPEEFEKRRGYSLYPWMPVLTGRVVGSVELSERFLWDFRQTTSDCIRDNFFGYLTELSSELGMKFESEAFTRSTSDGMEAAEVVTRTCSTFWQVGLKGFGKSPMSKWASSGAHVSGAKVITAEAFPAGAKKKNGVWLKRDSAWVNHPWTMKQNADNHMCSGVNHFLFHCFPLQPWAEKQNAVYKPGMIFKNWGTQYSQHNTWWEMSGAWHRYLSRCWYLQQQGTFAADVLYMTPESAPGNEKGTARGVRLPNGYDWDLCSSKAVKEELYVNDGEFCFPSGMRYKLLVLPEMENVTPALLEKLKELVAQGGQVMVRSRPERAHGLSGYPKSDKQVASLVDEIWQGLDGKKVKEQSYKKGKLYWGLTESQVVDKLALQPDLIVKTVNGDKKDFQHIHRYTEDEEIYFIAANSDATPTATFSFRVSGKVPEFWYPDTGVIEKCTVYKEENGRTEIPILFDTYGSVFVVFREGKAETPAALASIGTRPVLSVEEPLPAPTYSVFEKPGKVSLTMADGSKVEEAFAEKPTVTLNENWTVTFPKESDLTEPVRFKKLTPWNEHPEERIRYFSGTAVYSREFECDPNGSEVWFELGQVEVISELYINGKKAETLWKPPYRANITDLVKSGKNRVEVHVANLWPNRMIGDERFPRDFEVNEHGLINGLPEWLVEDKPRTEPRRKSFATCWYYSKDDTLFPSGLIGPVSVLYTPKFKNPKLQQVSDFVARHAVQGVAEEIAAAPDVNAGPIPVKIISAVYGTDEKFFDVTDKLAKLAVKNVGGVLEIGNYNKVFGQPHPRKVKKLTVTYSVDGKENTRVSAENKPIKFK